MAMTLGVSVVAMNRPDTLRQTVAPLVGTIPADTPVVLVDNGSEPPLTREAVGIPPSWTVLRNQSNLGLSRAVNQGLAVLAQMGCDILVHLDDDAVVTPNWARWFREVFEAHPEVGLALPNQDWYTEFIPRQDYRELRWGLGFAWAMRRETYELIGGYDAQLLHQQECDLALRVRMANYTVAAVRSEVIHNDPGRPAPDESWRTTGALPTVGQAREHLGCVQFRDKWCQYFRGRGWNYGTMPLYFMQHWPPDQAWYRRLLVANNIDLNPPPPERRQEAFNPGAVLGITAEAAASITRRLQVGSNWYMAFVEIQNDFAHWVHGDAYLRDRDVAIENWFKLTGEQYDGYHWPFNPLKCQ